jgi:hypothetical protein
MHFAAAVAGYIGENPGIHAEYVTGVARRDDL